MNFCRLVYLVLIMCCSLIVRAQSAMDDSLAKKVANTPLTFKKAEIYYQAGDDIAIQDTLKAIRYIRKGLQYAKGNPYYEGLGYFYLGRVYMDFSRQKAEKSFDTALQYFEPIISPESYISQSRTWANKAVIAQLNGDNTTYVNLFLEKVIPLSAKSGDSLRLADNYTYVSLPFMNYGEYDKAILYLNKSAALFQRLAPNDLRRVDVYCHLAKIYLLQDEIAEAGKQLNQALQVLQQDPESVYAPNFHAIESMYFIKRKQWSAADLTIETGLKIAEKLKSRYDIRQLLYQRAKLFETQQNWEKAEETLLKMYNEGYVELITDKQQLFADLAKVEEHLGNFQQAYNWMAKHAEVSAEVYAQQTRSQITSLEAKYNFAQKEKELLLAKAKKQKQLLWLTVSAAILLLTGLYFWYRNRKIRAVQQLKQQQQIELGKALLTGEERERSRIARDLHDGLGGILAGIKLNLSQMIETRKVFEKKIFYKQSIG